MPGLGRGLQSLIPKKTLGSDFASSNSELRTPNSQFSDGDGNPVVQGNGVLEVPIDSLRPNPHQPREHFSHTAIEELIGSIREHGILQPLIVTSKNDGIYELVAGERRLRAAKLAGLSKVPVIVRTATEQQKLELALIENIQRQDLSPIEEAKAYRQLIDEYNFTQEEVAKKMGKSRAYVANIMRLLNLPEEAQAAVADGRITPSNARTLAGLASPEEQKKWLAKILKDGMTAREAERSITAKKRVLVHDPHLAADEEELREALGTKVKIEKKAGKGMIAIGFYSDEEYRALIKRLKK